MEETISEKIKEEEWHNKIIRIGNENEKKAREFLEKNGYIIFDISELQKKWNEVLLNPRVKTVGEAKTEEYKKEKARLKREYGIFQISSLERRGCILSEKEKEYLKDNFIGLIGDLIGREIKTNRLTCFEVKASQKNYFLSGRNQFEENCRAKKNNLNVLYVFINYSESPIKFEIVDIAELWFNLHIGINELTNQIHQPINLIRKREAIEKKKKYYSNTFVQFEIIKCLKNRELCMLNDRIDLEKKSVRYCLAFNLDYLRKHFERFGFNKSLTNLYHSVALLKPSVPVFSYNFKKRRKEEAYRNFNENYKDYVEGYNLFIDIDADWDWKKALQDVLETKKIFDEFKVPYYVLNSSFKGFHIHIPAQYMPKKEISELLAEINEVIYNIKGIYDIQSIDTSIFDLKRVCKVPYSLSSDGSVCLPLDDEQLKNFTPKLVSLNNVLSKIKIMNRGLLIRTHNLSEEQLKENVKKLFSEFL